MECCVCQKTDDEVTLHKCPICFKYICTECEVTRHGRRFCSRACSDLFFFGDEDEE